MFGTQWLGSLAEDHCCCSSTGWNKAEHEAGGHGKPVMLAAGFAICSLPPLLWFQTTQQSLHQPWGVLCMGAVLCREDELLCWCCLQSTSTPSILQMHSLVKIICIISSVRWITPVETGQFFFFFFLLDIIIFYSADRKLPGQVWCVFGICTVSLNFYYSLWAETLSNCNLKNLKKIVWDSEMSCGLDECKTMCHYQPHHWYAFISVPEILFRHREVPVPTGIVRLPRKTVVSPVLEMVFKKQLGNLCQEWHRHTSTLQGSGPFQLYIHECYVYKK